MIRSFRSRDTEALFHDREVRRFRAFERRDGDAFDVEIVDYH